MIWLNGEIVDDAVRGLSTYHTRPIVSRHDLGDHEGFLIDPIEARYEPGELFYFQDVKGLEPGHPA